MHLADGYKCLAKGEKELLEREPKLGTGYESKCLPGYIISFGRHWESHSGRRLTREYVGSLLHTLVAARRRNWLMAREIKRLRGTTMHDPTTILTFAADVLAASVSGTPPEPSKEGGRESGPWYRDVPNTKQFLPAIRGYAESGGLLSVKSGDVTAVSVRIVPPLVPQDDKLIVPCAFELFGRNELHEFEIPYPSESVKRLCRGEWTKFGPGAVRLGSLLPTFSIEGENTIIAWDDPPEAQVQVWDQSGPLRRLLGRWIKSITTTEIRRLVITPEYVDVQAGGRVLNNLLPRLRLL